MGEGRWGSLADEDAIDADLGADGTDREGQDRAGRKPSVDRQGDRLRGGNLEFLLDLREPRSVEHGDVPSRLERDARRGREAGRLTLSVDRELGVDVRLERDDGGCRDFLDYDGRLRGGGGRRRRRGGAGAAVGTGAGGGARGTPEFRW